MSSGESDSTAFTAQNSSESATTDASEAVKESDDQSTPKISSDSNETSADSEPKVEEKGEGENSEMHVVRSKSVIKSPCKPPFVSSSATPVIKVIESSYESGETESGHETKKSQPTSVIAQSSLASTNFLQHSSIQMNSPFIPLSNNPFLKTGTSFSNFTSSSSPQNSESKSESSVIFAPPKLVTLSSNYGQMESSFLKPSVLKVSESNLDDLNKPSETISTSKMFISLNKEDIGKIKTPAFIKSSLEKGSLNVANGNTTSANKDCEEQESTDSSSTPTFLFGQKLEDRVVNSSFPTDLKSDNSKSDQLFTFSNVSNCDTTMKDVSSDNITSNEFKNECQDAIKNGDSNEPVFKRKYEVITGEEDEQNVLSIHGKLYAWDSDKTSWVEKGRGNLRLNDVLKNDKLCSRLVMRTSGALRVILNAHIVAGMKFELVNNHCLQFTYVDGIYMIKANQKDIDQLNSAIENRLREITKRVKTHDKEEESNGE